MPETTVADVLKHLRIKNGKNFSLKDFDPRATYDVNLGKRQGRERLQQVWLSRLAELQDKLYAHGRWGILIILQGIDASGKDSLIKHVMSGVNPQGCHVTSFKVPSAEELDHDYLWRHNRALPERGRIGIFNRSYYEEVLVVRVHPRVLAGQKLAEKLVTDRIWKERFEDINAYERYLSRNGIVVLKFFLNLSKGEQKRRFLRRLDREDKNWKFSLGDIEERKLWDDYQAAFEDMIRHTAKPWAPWHIISADRRWFARLVVASTLVTTLEGLDLHYPAVDDSKLERLQEARRLLMEEPD